MSLKTPAARGGLVGIILFVACIIWGYLLPSAAASLHFNLLQIVWPFFSLSLSGLIISLVQSYIYGWLFGWVVSWIITGRRS